MLFVIAIAVGKGDLMALIDWLWLVKLIIEILKLVAQLPADELAAIANLRSVVDLGDPPAPGTKTTKNT